MAPTHPLPISQVPFRALDEPNYFVSLPPLVLYTVCSLPLPTLDLRAPPSVVEHHSYTVRNTSDVVLLHF